MKPKLKKGFAIATPEQRKQWGSMGGKKAHKLGTAHRFTQEEAQEAGRKGAGRKKRPSYVSDE